MATVSFDFDGTLWDEEQQCFITETVAVLHSHLENGDRVIVVTARIQRWATEATELIAKHLGLHLQTFSCPGDADDWRCGDRLKSDVLIAENVVKHFDDIPNDSSLQLAKNSGIEILLPPATTVKNAVVTRMY